MAREDLLERFQGTQGQKHLVDCLRVQSLVRDQDIAQALAKCVRLEKVAYGTAIITEGSSDRDLVFILAGDFFVTKRRQVISRRIAGDHVGEMSVVDTDAPRSATVTSGSDALIARISEPDFKTIADRFPILWRRIAKELAERLRRATRPNRHGSTMYYVA